MVRELVRLARVQEWIKAAFVLLPIPFAVRAGAPLELGVVALGVLASCLTASAVYAFNDLRDAAADRASARKRHRPVASGRVPVPAAAVFSVSLLVAGLGIAFAIDRAAAPVVLLIYVALNLGYSLGLKHVPLLDVFLLSSGFLLRVLLGCALVLAAPSNWLLFCTFVVALFLSFAKRRADLAGGEGVEHRPALAGYSIGFLRHGMWLTATLSLLSYALYSQEAEVFVAGRELAGTPFVAFGLLHYLRVAETEDTDLSPVSMAYHSVTLQLCALGWLASTAWSLGLF